MAGLDAYILLRFERLCCQICLIGTIWGMLILVPIYYYAGNSDIDQFYIITMAHLESGSSYMWVPTVFAYVLTFHVCYLLNKEYETFAELRQDFLCYGKPLISKSIFLKTFPSVKYCRSIFMNKFHLFIEKNPFKHSMQGSAKNIVRTIYYYVILPIQYTAMFHNINKLYCPIEYCNKYIGTFHINNILYFPIEFCNKYIVNHGNLQYNNNIIVRNLDFLSGKLQFLTSATIF
jgi:hypothetical protein